MHTTRSSCFSSHVISYQLSRSVWATLVIKSTMHVHIMLSAVLKSFQLCYTHGTIQLCIKNTVTIYYNNATIMICSLLTILQCLHSESCTVWSSPSSIDCCHLHRVACEWSQSSQHMLSAPLSCSVHNGGAIAVAQSVSSDGSSLVRAGYCPPLHSQ